MSDQDKINEIKDAQDVQESQDAAAQQPEQPADACPAAKWPCESKRFMWLAIISIVITALSWILAGFNAWLGIGLSVAAVVVGALALKSHRHSIRNTAITSIIAATVLLVVISAFLIVIYLGLKTVS